MLRYVSKLTLLGVDHHCCLDRGQYVNIFPYITSFSASSNSSGCEINRVAIHAVLSTPLSLHNFHSP